MTIHEPRTSRGRLAGRFLWHYAEMVVAMLLGMLLLGLLWDAVLPEITRTDVSTLVMAADMTIGMAVWMRVRRHGWPGIAEMSLAMFAPFLILLVPYWLGVLPGHLLMSIGHVLMFVLMALAMLRRRSEYTHPLPRLRVRPKWAWRAGVVLIALLVPGVVSAVNTIGKFGDLYTAPAAAAGTAPVSKTGSHDPAKPTVALLTSGSGTNVADLLGPYEVLAGTGLINVYTVSSGAQLVPLTGGLDLVPDLTFDELGRLLSERRDTLDAVMIPALHEPGPAELGSITGWLRRQSAAGALVMSVCNGARTFAASGLLDGRTATSHWLRLSGLRADFGKVGWVSGRRYVDDGNVITTAGVLSGVEGGLRLIERLIGTDAAREAAGRVHWRHYVPGGSTRIPENSLEPGDAVVALNASYQPGPSAIGVQVGDGVGEIELASAFISYTEQAMVGRTVAVGDGPVRSRNGLTFVPRSTLAAAADDLDRLLVPGLEAARRHSLGTGPSAATGGLRPEYLHTGTEFAFDPVLRDIARTYDVRTAQWTAKTLEYPVFDIELTGSAWPWPATAIPVVLALLAGGAAVAAGIVFRRLRTA
ncbi:DJ-1/PfpI family protein [Nonomuraea zeae]|uniref:AraC family transcriptional regulator n=1 Tax=Nonomuraea zeae TaxID=1642303 RepID=A0A5S4GV76_9ACTN|nr:DJ-1/PfpI family protein [Nonomuraea zeae]TMR36855.1 AraC family transcriptional regulator [Nonomuraea zeae]